jgi:hypothetical protein
VYVPREDSFYSYGALPNGTIITEPESRACDISGNAVYIVFDSNGRGEFASDCRAAVEAAHLTPRITGWYPSRVTPAMVAQGFDLAITGHDFGAVVSLVVGDRTLPTVQGRRGRLMTASIPANPGLPSSIVFDVEHRGQRVFSGTIQIGDTVK